MEHLTGKAISRLSTLPEETNVYVASPLGGPGWSYELSHCQRPPSQRLVTLQALHIAEQGHHLLTERAGLATPDPKASSVPAAFFPPRRVSPNPPPAHLQALLQACLSLPCRPLRSQGGPFTQKPDLHIVFTDVLLSVETSRIYS